MDEMQCNWHIDQWTCINRHLFDFKRPFAATLPSPKCTPQHCAFIWKMHKTPLCIWCKDYGTHLHWAARMLWELSNWVTIVSDTEAYYLMGYYSQLTNWSERVGKKTSLALSHSSHGSSAKKSQHWRGKKNKQMLIINVVPSKCLTREEERGREMESEGAKKAHANATPCLIL